MPNQTPKLTEAQRLAILCFGGRIWGRHNREAEIAALLPKPLEELTVPEASEFLVQLRDKCINVEANR